ncbi:MAG: hypothetical protein ACOYBM_03260 [Dethiobacteria bacterium]|jgi:transcription initiation factor TFIIIB Brf1 subunit/transcription initiation factor TFIIB
MRIKEKIKKFFFTFSLLVVIAAAIYIVATDQQSYREHSSGAGDIWWVDVPEIERVYKELLRK